MMTKQQGLLRKSQIVLSDFDNCAQDWGWESDQGSGHDVDRSEINYLNARKAITDRLIFLEGKNRKLSRKLKALQYEDRS
jgi:hypothetical protein